LIYFEQLSEIQQCVKERKRTVRNAYWTRIGPRFGPRFNHSGYASNAARTATSMVNLFQGFGPLSLNLAPAPTLSLVPTNRVALQQVSNLAAAE
jgi:GH25 family lysozyme M1 (1,4-beta-N-acetylmuramidase)